jgi:hypothetical protein
MSLPDHFILGSYGLECWLGWATVIIAIRHHFKFAMYSDFSVRSSTIAPYHHPHITT